MRCDEYRPEPESAQAGLPGWGGPGEASVARVLAFESENPETFAWMLANARRLAARNGYLSAKYLVEMARNERGARIRNADSPAFARVIRARCPELAGAIRTARSRCDAWAPAPGDGR